MCPRTSSEGAKTAVFHVQACMLCSGANAVPGDPAVVPFCFAVFLHKDYWMAEYCSCVIFGSAKYC